MQQSLRLAVCLWAMAGFGTAMAQISPSLPPPLHRFVGTDGLGIGTLKRSDIEALWGRAEVEKRMEPKSRKAHDRRPWLLLEYKSRGLTFSTPVGSYGQADPPIAHAVFTAPFVGCTPQGLCMGMPQEEAVKIIWTHYKLAGDVPLSWGSGSPTGRSLFGHNKGWRKTHSVGFDFKEGRLHSMSFQLEPTPLVAWNTVRKVLAWTLLITIVVGATVILRPYRQQIAPVLRAAKVGFALYALASLAIGAVLLYALFKR